MAGLADIFKLLAPQSLQQWQDANAEKIARNQGAFHAPTLRDRISTGIEEGLKLTGTPAHQARGVAQPLTEVVENVTPAGLFTAAQDAQEEAGKGNYMAGSLAALGAVPGVGPETRALAKEAGLAGDLAGTLSKAVAPIKVYHGSPHSFDKFDISKIGTGEGAQAYGHGLYFAESPGVAKSYQENLSSGAKVSHPQLGDNLDPLKLDDLFTGEVVKASPDLPRERAEQIGTQITEGLRTQSDLAHMEKFVRESDWDPPEKAAWLAGLKRAKEFQTTASPGSLYEVDINADPEHFLDWDKGLHQQSETVQDKLGWTAERRAEYDATTKQVNDALLNALQSDADPAIIDELSRRADELNRQVGVRRDATGAEIVSGNSVFQSASDAEKARALREKGIPGIKYLDQGSRASGEGSRNYVVFDDKLISIVKKNGIAVALAAGLITESQAAQLREQGYE